MTAVKTGGVAMAVQKLPVGDPCGPDSEMFYEFDFIEHDQNLVKLSSEL